MPQNLKWGGGSFAVGFNNNRQEQSDLFATRNPALNTSLTRGVHVQPLLRNFRIDAVRTQLKITQLNQQMSETSLRATIVRTVANVRNAYWDLVFAIQAAEVAESSLTLASKLVEDNQARVEVGTLAPLDVVQAQAEQATRRQAVAQARGTHGTAELALKRLIVNGTEDPYWTANIEPIDRPTYSTETIDVAAAVRRALAIAHRPRTVQEADSGQRRLAPKPDRRAVAGPRPDRLLRPGRGRRTAVRPACGSGARRGALADHSERIQRRAGLAHERTRADVELRRQLQLSDRHEPRRGGDRACASAAAADDRASPAARAADCDRSHQRRAAGGGEPRAPPGGHCGAELAELRLDAEQSRFEVGLSTNFFVVQAQRDLRDAQNAELRALLDYRRAQVEFERVQEIPSAGTVGITNIQRGNATAPRANVGGGGNFGGTRLVIRESGIVSIS